jgi:hypothetical protein
MERYLGFAAAVVCLLTACTRSGHAQAAQAGPQSWETWQPPVVTYPNPNAYDTYLQAIAAKAKVDRAHGHSRPIPPPDALTPQQWWDEGPTDLPPEERVNLYAPISDLIAQALTRPCRLPAPQSYDELFPYYIGFREMARFLAMRAHVTAAKGDYDGAAASALDAIAMAQQVATSRWLLGYLVGVGCEDLGRRALDEVIPGLDRAGCEKALRRLEAIDKMRVPLLETIGGEEVFSRRVFKDLMAHPEKLPWFSDDTMSQDAQALLMAKMRAGSWQAIDAFWQDLRARLAKPYGERGDIPKPTDPYLKIVEPVMSSIWLRDAELRAQSALRQVWLAVRCYQIDKRRLPASLQDLLPDYLVAIPTDPFSGKPLLANAATGAFVIYSVGPDCRDDGGSPIQGNVTSKSTGDIIRTVQPAP